MASTDQFDPSDLEQLLNELQQRRRINSRQRQLFNELNKLRSTDPAERRVGNHQIARRFRTRGPQEARRVLEGLLSELVPIIIGKLGVLDEPRLHELVLKLLMQIWCERTRYDPNRCDFGAWMLYHAGLVWGKMLAEGEGRSHAADNAFLGILARGKFAQGVEDSQTEKTAEEA
jgi:hypothetical protein